MSCKYDNFSDKAKPHLLWRENFSNWSNRYIPSVEIRPENKGRVSEGRGFTVLGGPLGTPYLDWQKNIMN